MTYHTTTDCRSEDGITVGLIDAVISISRILGPRLTFPRVTEAVAEAVIDLWQDRDVRTLFPHNVDANRYLPPIGTDGLLKRIVELEDETKRLRKAITELEPRAAFGDQCYQDRCENAYVEASVVKRLQAEIDALNAADMPRGGK